MPNRCYRGAKVLHFSGKRAGRRAESDALAPAAPPQLPTRQLVNCSLPHALHNRVCTPLHAQNTTSAVFLLAKRLAVAKK